MIDMPDVARYVGFIIALALMFAGIWYINKKYKG